jgi:hypothetical protein
MRKLDGESKRSVREPPRSSPWKKPWRKSALPEGINEIEDHALHLPHDDFYELLTNFEAGLPADVDPAGARTSGAGSPRFLTKSSVDTGSATAAGSTKATGPDAPRTQGRARRIVYPHRIRYLPADGFSPHRPQTFG